MKNFLTKQFLLFLCVGIIATIVNFSSRIFYNQWTSFSAAVILAYFTAAMIFFICAKKFIFKNSQYRTYRSLLIFVIVNIISAGITWAVSMVFIVYILPGFNIIKFSAAIAHLSGISASFLLSFILHKYWTFREY